MDAEAASPYSGTPEPKRPGLALMKAITEGDQRAYLAAQAEALAILGWLAKFANALLVERADSARSGETAS